MKLHGLCLQPRAWPVVAWACSQAFQTTAACYAKVCTNVLFVTATWVVSATTGMALGGLGMLAGFPDYGCLLCQGCTVGHKVVHQFFQSRPMKISTYTLNYFLSPFASATMDNLQNTLHQIRGKRDENKCCLQKTRRPSINIRAVWLGCLLCCKYEP